MPTYRIRLISHAIGPINTNREILVCNYYKYYVFSIVALNISAHGA
jgi:hypothetical protein